MTDLPKRKPRGFWKRPEVLAVIDAVWTERKSPEDAAAELDVTLEDVRFYVNQMDKAERKRRAEAKAAEEAPIGGIGDLVYQPEPARKEEPGESFEEFERRHDAEHSGDQKA